MTDLNQLSSRDLDRLSAYLDGELSPREADRIRARLLSEPELESALQALQATVTLFKQLPQLRPPRNFTLTEEVKPRGYPILQFSTALAAFAFVLVVGADALVRGSVEEREAALFSSEPEVAAPLTLSQTEGEQALDLDSSAEAEAPAAELEQQGELGFAEPAAPSEQAAAADESAFADKLEELDDSVMREVAPSEESDPSFFDGAAAGEPEGPEAIQQPVMEDQQQDLLLPALRFGEIILGTAVLVLAALTLWVRRR